MTVELSDQAAIEEFLDRYHRFHDAVVTEVAFAFTPARAERTANVSVLAELGGTGASADWHTVVFRIRGVRAFRFEEGRTSHLVLSLGLRLYALDDGLFLDLAPASTEALPPEELQKSLQYVSGDTCSADVGPAPDWTK